MAVLKRKKNHLGRSKGKALGCRILWNNWEVFTLVNDAKARSRAGPVGKRKKACGGQGRNRGHLWSLSIYRQHAARKEEPVCGKDTGVKCWGDAGRKGNWLYREISSLGERRLEWASVDAELKMEVCEWLRFPRRTAQETRKEDLGAELGKVPSFREQEGRMGVLGRCEEWGKEKSGEWFRKMLSKRQGFVRRKNAEGWEE